MDFQHHRETVPSEKLWGSNENPLQTTKFTNTVTKLDVCGETLDVSTLEEEEEEEEADTHNKGGSLSDVTDCTTSWMESIGTRSRCLLQTEQWVCSECKWVADG